MSCTDGAMMLDFEAGQRSALAASAFGSLLDGEAVVDLFCGGGGWGDGILDAGIRTDFAINHDATAIEFHAKNHPWCVHHQGDAWRTRPRDVVGRRRVGLLLASAACTTHSRARGSAPVSKRVHMLGTCILRWMKDVEPRCVIVENVSEWMDWGPLIEKRHANGRPVRDEQGRVVWVHDPERKGQKWRWWLRQARRLGYELDYRVLDAADFGAASRRKRLFVILRRDGAPIVWPERSHGPSAKASNGRGSAPGTPAKPFKAHRAAAEIIDWSDLGTSIFDRPRPLADKTLGRICEGIRRFVLSDPSPFLLRVTQTGSGGGWKVSPVEASMPTQTTRQDLAVCSPVLAPQNTDVYGQRVDACGPTITTKGHQAVISPVLATTGYGEREGQTARVHRVAELLGTCVNGSKQGLASAVITPCGGPERQPADVRETYGTVLTREDRGICAPVLTHFRHGGGQHSGLRDPLHTPTSGGNHAAMVAALFIKFYGNETGGQDPKRPLGTVTTLDRHGVVCCVLDGEPYVIVDILFRMLRPRELAAAMGFRPEYIWPASQRDATRLIGNAVSPPMARALVRAMLPDGAAPASGAREAVAA